MNLKVSSVICCYNNSEFVGDAIKSIQKQSYPVEEIIVVDDCSTDNSRDIIDGFAKDDNRIKVIYREVNSGGVPEPRNNGIAAARNPIVSLLDADDFYYKEKIERAVKVFEEHPEVSVVYSDYDVWDIRTNSRRREFKHPYDTRVLWQASIVSTNSVVRKEIFERAGYFNNDIKFAEDYEMWLRAARMTMFYHVAEPLFCYRLHGKNITLTKQKEMAEYIVKFKQEFAKKYGQ